MSNQLYYLLVVVITFTMWRLLLLNRSLGKYSSASASVIFSLLCSSLDVSDYYSYMEMFYAIPPIQIYIFNIGIVPGTEYGFEILISTLRTLGISYELFRFIIITLSLYLKIKLFERISENPQVALAAYFGLFAHFDLVAIRQSLAISILAFSIYFYLNNQNKKYWFSALVAISFHSSATLALLAPLLNLLAAWSFCTSFIFLSYFTVVRGGIGIALSQFLISLSPENPISATLSVYLYQREIYPQEGLTSFGTLSLILMCSLFLINIDRRIKNNLWVKYSWLALIFLTAFQDFGMAGVLSDRLYRALGVSVCITYSLLPKIFSLPPKYPQIVLKLAFIGLAYPLSSTIN